MLSNSGYSIYLKVQGLCYQTLDTSMVKDMLQNSRYLIVQGLFYQSADTSLFRDILPNRVYLKIQGYVTKQCIPQGLGICYQTVDTYS